MRELTSIMYTPTTSIKHLNRKINMGTDDILGLSLLTEEVKATHTDTGTIYKYILCINHSPPTRARASISSLGHYHLGYLSVNNE